MIRRFSISIGGRVVATLLQVWVFAMIARALGVSEFGAFSLSLTVALAVLTFSDLGMGTRVLAGINSPDERNALATFAIFRYTTAVAIFGAAALVGAVIGANVILLTAAAMYAVGEATGDLAVGFLQGKLQSLSAMTTLLVRRIAALVPLLFFEGELGVVVAGFLAGGLGLSVFAFAIRRSLGRPSNVVHLVRNNGAIILSNGSTKFASLDVLIVGFAAGAYGAGLYAAAVRLFNPLNLAVSTLMQVLVPELARSRSRSERLSAFRRTRLIVGGLSLALVALSPLAPVVMSVLFGSSYDPAAPVAVAVFACAGLSAVAQVHLSWFYATAVPRIVPISMWAAVAVGLGLIWILSASHGVIGSAYGLVAMHALIAAALVGCWYIAEREVRD